MQPEIFDAIGQSEKHYWWFVGRRKLVLDFFIRLRRRPASTGVAPRILDVGCGTGAMLDDFAPHGSVFGTDLSPIALQYCHRRGQQKVLFADGTRLPFHGETFDCITAMDVIEHIEDDLAALREFYRTCLPGGLMLITVPALRWLWTTRDLRLAHFRRYHRSELIGRAQEAGFHLEKCSYYCASMFPAFAGVVLLDKLRGRKPDVKQDVPKLLPLVNALLVRIILFEQWLMRWINYPFGVSLFCVLRKPAERSDEV